MKKLFLLAAMLLCMCLSANAQAKLIVNNGLIGLDWKFKRSFLSGNTLVVDFVVENNTSKDEWCAIIASQSASWGESVLKAYDDEGNVYESNALMGGVPFSGKIGGKNLLNEWESIPSGNMIKVRLQIAGIDEYATLIKTLTVPIMTSNENRSELRVTNIPIPRE